LPTPGYTQTCLPRPRSPLQFFPCKLSLLLLPWHELLAVAGAAEAHYAFGVVLRSPRAAMSSRLLALQLGCLVRAAGSLSLAVYSLFWLLVRCRGTTHTHMAHAARLAGAATTAPPACAALTGSAV
jgi:hypothetical protein